MKQNTKDWIQYGSAILMIVSAIVLVFLAFALTQGLASGVLIYVGQALCYAGGIFGVSLYFKNQLGEFESNTKDKIEKIVEDYLESKE